MLKNPEKTKNEIVQWIRDYFAANGPTCDAVIGISGGKDSSITAALLAEALGKDRVIGVMMPNGVQSDISDSQEIVDLLGIKNVTVNIKDGFDGLSSAINSALAESDTVSVDTLSRDSIIPIHATARKTSSVIRRNSAMQPETSVRCRTCLYMRLFRLARCSACRRDSRERRRPTGFPECLTRIRLGSHMQRSIIMCSPVSVRMRKFARRLTGCTD